MKTVRVASLTGIGFLLAMCSPVHEQQKNQSPLNSRAQEMRAYTEKKMISPVSEQKKNQSPLNSRAQEMKMYAQKKGYSNRYCFLLDMRLHSGLKRFFVYDLTKNTIAFSGLVAHGSCEDEFLIQAKFSNKPGGGCSSIGVYKVGCSYYGQYGKAYKLYGLENSNSNAFKRAVVLHSYSCVPDQEIYPKPLCNSSGCAMVSSAFLKNLSSLIDKSNKPILLWIYV